MQEVDETKEVRYKFPSVPKKFKGLPKLDLATFGLALHAVMKSSVVGYMLQIRKKGKRIQLTRYRERRISQLIEKLRICHKISTL